MHGHIFYIIKGTRRFLTRLKKWQPVKKYCNHYAFVISLCICLLNCHSVHSSAKNCIRIFGSELLCTRINLVCLCFFNQKCYTTHMCFSEKKHIDFFPSLFTGVSAWRRCRPLAASCSGSLRQHRFMIGAGAPRQ